MASMGNDEGWEVASSRKGKCHVQLPAGRGKPAAAFSQERSGYSNGRGAPLPNTLNAQRSASTTLLGGNERALNNENPSKPRNFNLNSIWQSNRESYMGQPAALVLPPRAIGWQWGNRTGSGNSSNASFGKEVGENASDDNKNVAIRPNLPASFLPFEQSGELSRNTNEEVNQDSETGSEIENLDSDDEYISSDGFDSDSSNVSHETLKKNKWFKDFFLSLDSLTLEQVNDPERQWHCPACKGGVGAIDWYRGMQPVLSHAKTIRTKRVKLHRKLAEALEEELRRRGTGCVIAEEMFGKWKGLQETLSDHQIVWPPMVVIQNTRLDQDDNEKWIGMGNKELLEYFKEFKASKARHAYGPKGHRGMSLLIFEDSAVGYMEAERLHKQFLREGRGRKEWDRHPTLFLPGGKRVLYGYFATEKDLEIFNLHSKGKTRLKYSLGSYIEMVVKPMRQMETDTQKLNFLETKDAKNQDYKNIMEKEFGQVRSQLRIKDLEIRIIRQRATDQHEEHRREMEFLEQTYKQQIDELNNHMSSRELQIEKMLEDFKRHNIDCCNELEASNKAKDREEQDDKEPEKWDNIDKEIERRKAIVESSIKDSEEYERERQELIALHDKRRKEMKLRHLKEGRELETKFMKERDDLLEKYLKKGEDAGYTIV